MCRLPEAFHCYNPRGSALAGPGVGDDGESGLTGGTQSVGEPYVISGQHNASCRHDPRESREVVDIHRRFSSRLASKFTAISSSFVSSVCIGNRANLAHEDCIKISSSSCPPKPIAHIRPPKNSSPNPFMKIPIMLAIIGAASFALSACQNGSHTPPDDFAQKTHRTYNPETGSFEQSPPWGKQSNKSGNE